MKRRAYSGFTLIELMIVVTIVGVLAAFAVPSYRTYIVKSHRADAKKSLLSAAVAEEKWRTSNIQYTATIFDAANPSLKLDVYSCASPISCVTPDRYYTISVTTWTATHYTIRADANTSPYNQAANDSACAQFFIDQSGTKTATSVDCW